MSVDITDYVDSLRREVTPPGSTTFVGVGDTVFEGYLADAFWEARLDGFLVGFSCDEDGIVTADGDGGADISRDKIALIILYAGLKILRNKLLETNTRTRAKAGPVEFESENSANLLTEMAKQLAAVKQRLLDLQDFSTATYLVDQYTVRSWCDTSYGAWLSDTLCGVGLGVGY